MSLKDICAMLTAAGLGAGAVVAPIAHEPTRTKIAKKAGYVKKRAAKPRATPAPAATPSTSLLSDCPLPGVGAMGAFIPELGANDMSPAFPRGNILYDERDNIFYSPKAPLHPKPPAITPGVPELHTWVMMVSGFGLIGLAMRRRRVATNAG